MKDINKYMGKLHGLEKKVISEIVVAGHSLEGIDMPYFRYIDFLTQEKLKWIVVWYDYKNPDAKIKRDTLKQKLIDGGVDEGRIRMIPSWDFYELEGNDEDARRKLSERKNGFGICQDQCAWE